MFDNLLLTSVLIIILWVGGFIFYLYTSRQQRLLQEEVETLKQMLDEDENQTDDQV